MICYMYKYVWIQFISKDKVPSGFGVAMAIFMLLSIFKIDLSNFDKIFFCIIFFLDLYIGMMILNI